VRIEGLCAAITMCRRTIGLRLFSGSVFFKKNTKYKNFTMVEIDEDNASD